MKTEFGIFKIIVLTARLILPVLLSAQQTQPDLARRMDSLFLDAEKQGFHGNVLVSQQGNIILLKGYGYANEEEGRRYDATTLVQIGSNVKDFTKTAVYQLVERALLRLDDTLGKFVPGLSPDKSAITIQQLLEHEAGLPLGMGGDDYPLTESEMLQRLRDYKLLFSPGSKEQYSNIGYSLLALIIGKLSGMPFDTYVLKNILKPLGLDETGSYLPKFDRDRIAHGYKGNQDIGIILDMPHDAEGHYWNLRGNGGYLSTLTEMDNFYKALEDTFLIKDKKLRQQVFSPDNSSFLAGSDRISFFLFANMPASNTRIFLASNHSEFMADRLIKKLEGLLGIKDQRNGMNSENQTENSVPLIAQLPETGIGITIGAYIKAYNSGDTSLMRSFYLNYTAKDAKLPPLATRMERYIQMRQNLGSIIFQGYRKSSEEGGWEVSVSTESGDPAIFTFFLEKESPFGLISMRVMVGD